MKVRGKACHLRTAEGVALVLDGCLFLLQLGGITCTPTCPLNARFFVIAVCACIWLYSFEISMLEVGVPALTN
jgi:hypothetical protein